MKERKEIKKYANRQKKIRVGSERKRRNDKYWPIMRHDHTMNAIHRILEFPLHDLMQSIDKIGQVAYFVYDKW